MLTRLVCGGRFWTTDGSSAPSSLYGNRALPARRGAEGGNYGAGGQARSESEATKQSIPAPTGKSGCATWMDTGSSVRARVVGKRGCGGRPRHVAESGGALICVRPLFMLRQRDALRSLLVEDGAKLRDDQATSSLRQGRDVLRGCGVRPGIGRIRTEGVLEV